LFPSPIAPYKGVLLIPQSVSISKDIALLDFRGKQVYTFFTGKIPGNTGISNTGKFPGKII